MGEGWHGCEEDARIDGDLGEPGMEDGLRSEKEKGPASNYHCSMTTLDVGAAVVGFGQLVCDGSRLGTHMYSLFYFEDPNENVQKFEDPTCILLL